MWHKDRPINRTVFPGADWLTLPRDLVALLPSAGLGAAVYDMGTGALLGRAATFGEKLALGARYGGARVRVLSVYTGALDKNAPETRQYLEFWCETQGGEYGAGEL